VADLGYMLTIARGIPDEKTRNAVVQIVTHLSGNIRIGVPEHQTRAVNLQAYFLQSTTPASTGEFTIAHGLPSTPHYAIVRARRPCLWKSRGPRMRRGCI
jgi:hypothetical protein